MSTLGVIPVVGILKSGYLYQVLLERLGSVSQSRPLRKDMETHGPKGFSFLCMDTLDTGPPFKGPFLKRDF